MTCMKQEFCIHEKYCQRHIGQNFDSCLLFSRNSKPMTNEEWFTNLSTEEKARFLACEFTVACDDYAYSNNKETWNEKYWLEWLKEKHHEMQKV